MTDDRPKTEALDVALDEARQHLVPRDVDWSRVEARLAARLDAGDGARPASRGWLYAGTVLAAAAAAVVLVVRSQGTTPVAGPVAEGAPVAQDERPRRASLRHAGPIEAVQAAASFEEPGRATWKLEPGTRARVSSTPGNAILVAIEAGAIEADVVKSTLPESFVVEVAEGEHAARVAVHGTHLRVARQGARVVVDLSEGEIAIGRAPRDGGLTQGVVVRAPAHAELDVTDVEGTTRVTVPGVATAPPAASAAHRSPTAPAPSAARLGARPEVIADAVRACARSSERPGAARVVVASVIHLEVGNDHQVKNVRFDPPLAPAVQACAAETIYRTRLEPTGDVRVDVSFAY